MVFVQKTNEVFPVLLKSFSKEISNATDYIIKKITSSNYHFQNNSPIIYIQNRNYGVCLTKIAAAFHHTSQTDAIPVIASLKNKHIDIVHLLLKKFQDKICFC